MIEYLIFETETECLDAIGWVKENGYSPLVDFPIKFKDEQDKEFFLFVVLDDFRETLTDKLKDQLLHSIPEELTPCEPN